MTDDQTQHMWHREAITPEVEKILGELQRRSHLADFYLAGGTGLALQLGHRRSVDLDFFTEGPFQETRFIPKLDRMEGLSIEGTAEGTIHASFGRVKVTFLAYAYPVLFPFSSFAGARVADPRDIGCMKITTIMSRGTRRDFVDLYVIAKTYGLSQILTFFQEKYARTNYSIVLVLKSLTYFADAESDKIFEGCARPSRLIFRQSKCSRIFNERGRLPCPRRS